MKQFFGLRYETALVIVASALSGCATQHEASDLRDSKLVLYPLAKTGDALSAIGEGIHKISTPGSWSDLNVPHFPQRPSEAQRNELAGIAVRYDSSFSLQTSTGLGAGSIMYQEPLRSFLVSTENAVGYQFDWYITPGLGDGARSIPGGVILLNPSSLNSLSAPAITFMLLHEAGHHVLGHMSAIGMAIGTGQTWLVPSMELQADAFAAEKMVAEGFQPNVVVYAAMEIFGQSPGDITHPPGPIRVRNVMNTIGYVQ